MIRLANPKIIPFFERIPTRALPAVRKACELIDLTATTPAVAYSILRDDLRIQGVTPPELDEFKVWFEEVRLGRFSATDYGGETAAAPATKGRSEQLERSVMDCVTGEVVTSTVSVMERPVTPDDADPAALALPVIEKAWALREALIAAGYRPESVDNGDQLVAEAIEGWLRAQAACQTGKWFGISPTTYALGMLDCLDNAAEEKFLGVLTTHMQAELLAAIVNSRPF